jgi:integrase
MHPAEVTYALVHEFMRWRVDAQGAAQDGRKCATWNTALVETRVLGAVMQEAVRRGFILVSPCVRLGLPRRNAKEKREISAEEQEKIEGDLAAAPQWMADCWLVAIKHGCRLSETAVSMSSVDEANGVIVFRVKGSKDHAAPIHSDLLALVARRREMNAARLVDLPEHAASAWHKWFKKNGYEGVSFHCTRVTVVTRLARAGFSEVQTMQYVGHASETVHAVYRKLRPADLKHLGVVL